jgi:phytoene synthase
MDASPRRYATFAELEPYCHRVASAVGLICAEIFGYREARVRDYARELGVALQLTNILRDVAVDYRRGRLYLPQDELARFGCTESDVCREVERAGRGVQAPQVRALLAHQAARARDYFARATALLPATDARRFVAAEIMREVYWELLRRIEAADLDVFSSVIRVPRPAQARIAIRTWWTHSHFSDHRQS